MHHEPLSQRLSLVKQALAEVEDELVEADACPDGLEDFKSALDHIRLSAWAVLTAVEAKNFQHSAVLARFRLARLTEMCRSIRSDIAGGLLNQYDAGIPVVLHHAGRHPRAPCQRCGPGRVGSWVPPRGPVAAGRPPRRPRGGGPRRPERRKVDDATQSRPALELAYGGRAVSLLAHGHAEGYEPR
jgi:hypothetical protein